MPPIPREDYEMLTSPWAPSLQEESWVGRVLAQLAGLVEGDRERGRLLALLAMFSPVNLQLDNEDILCLKANIKYHWMSVFGLAFCCTRLLKFKIIDPPMIKV